MRILYLTHEYLDYLSDELLYGLRSLFGDSIVDFPRKEILYRSAKDSVPPSLVWGNGATAFGLPDISVDRDDIATKIKTGYFDYIVNSNCWRIHSPVYKNLVVLDGQDHHLLNPTYLGRVVAYFKRELRWNVNDVQPIQFSFPDHLIDTTHVEKNQKVHASFSVYPGLRQEIAGVYGSRLFNDWHAYMQDIKRSWFGISPKGEGYDCQRHYEILGNAVLCIYQDSSTPRILKEAFVDGVNCLTFSSVDELRTKIERCTDPELLLRNGKQALLDKHLSSRRAQQMIDTVAAVHGTRRRYYFYSALKYGYVPYYSREIVNRLKTKLSSSFK